MAAWAVEPPVISDYIVAHLDVMGQKELLDLLRKKPTDDQEEKEFARARAETYDAILYFRQRVLAALQSSWQDAISMVPSLTDHTTARTRRHIGFFSDCIRVTLRYGDDRRRPPVLDVWHLLTSLSLTMIMCISNRIPIRGAIELGRGFELPDEDIYGPIAVDAYELESEIALYPRVVVGQELCSCLRGWVTELKERNRGYYDSNKSQIQRCNDMVSADKDGVPVLEYLGEDMRCLFSSRSEITDAVRSGLNFIDGEYERFRTSPDPTDSRKAWMYYLARDYYSSRSKDIWGIL